MKIEELSDDFADTVKVSEPQQNASQPPPPPADLLTQAMNAFASSSPITNPDGSPGPNLPPAMEAMRNKSADEILADLNKSPLFMTNLEENDDLEALKALAYEGSPLEVASGFKERGNESFKEKGWRDAKEFYGKGIQVLLLEVRKRQKGEVEGEEDKEETKKEVGVLEACLVNRAACHLELGNYRSCVQDCGSALRINSKNVKAYYRSAKALLKLDKILEADDSCARGLAIDPENKALQVVAKEIIKRNEQVEKRRKMELERENRRRLEEVTLRAALKARGIKTRSTPQPPEMEDARISLVPNPTDPQSSVSFPTVLLYPLNLESDFIKSFNETQSVGDHLSYILPLPWDSVGAYTVNGVECYMETVTGGLIKVGRKVSLLKVLTSGNVEVVDGVVKIFVLPKASSEAWVQEFKRKKAGEKVGS
ncbi:related to hsp90 chaperone complex associated protein CNS1 [Phialocephala subalpina]|uniref:Related to hsp90 chaperone complex associated protein CNS1 n=1 Tax=Phialocephala subalpina TaxID=576137 RepID=A0A1L7XAX3_9HELO|nr:related to hsp90 chaperone complex associated protein CNS1 [Phialocephala subalpina]